MEAPGEFNNRPYDAVTVMRAFADQAFSRAAGAPLTGGNNVRLLKDARENYPAWLTAIGAAKHHIHFENYIIREDRAGHKFADALIAKAREGVRVRLIYDWLGGFGKTSRHFWNYLREGGVEVRCYNPPRFDSPFSWLSRDHRKMIAVDGQVGFVTGLCVGQMWEGFPEKNIEPWRDTGIEVRGIAVADIERAFAQIWAMIGEPIPDDEILKYDGIPSAAGVSLRIVASGPATAGMFRLDQLVAALARKKLWLTDAYYAGTTAYVQALRAAVKDGVDVRLLVPGGTDLPLFRPVSRAGYRPLLEAGIRVFEWNGSMLHAKTAVADGQWARVGSTNLNVSSWFGNWELDVVIENDSFAGEMEEMYIRDLMNSTELILDARQKVSAPGRSSRRSYRTRRNQGSVGRAAAGAVRLGNAVGAAFTRRRVLEPMEARLMSVVGISFLILSALFAFFPRLIAYPLFLVFVWFGAVLLYKSYKLYHHQSRGGAKKKANDC